MYREFVEQAKRFLAECPQIRHAWEYADESHCTLEIPVQCEGGFTITVEVSAEEIMVGAGGAHTNLIFDDGDPKEFVGRALGLIRDLVSPVMRVRERTAGGKPYWWAFESLMDGKWHTEESVGLLVWNWFGKRSQRTYQNTILPSRNFRG
jgi:hypothetical protein